MNMTLRIHEPKPCDVVALNPKGGAAQSRPGKWRSLLGALIVGGMLAAGMPAAAQSKEVLNGPEVAGFRGLVTGTVKSAHPDAPNFVLLVSKAAVDAATS